MRAAPRPLSPSFAPGAFFEPLAWPLFYQAPGAFTFFAPTTRLGEGGAALLAARAALMGSAARRACDAGAAWRGGAGGAGRLL